MKLLEQQNANDSGDDNQQQRGKPRHHHHSHHHKKVRIPRVLSPLRPKPSLTLPTQATTAPIPSNSKSQDLVQSEKTNPSPTSIVSTMANENEFKKSASSNSLAPPTTGKPNPHSVSTNPNRSMKYNNQQQRNFPRSLSKSFSSSSSSSSPPPYWFNNPVRRKILFQTIHGNIPLLG